MTRTYLLTLKIINLVFYVWLLLTFLLTIFDFDAVITTADNELVILAFFGAVRNVFSYIIYGGYTNISVTLSGTILSTELKPSLSLTIIDKGPRAYSPLTFGSRT